VDVEHGMPKSVTIFITTARSGTQRVAASLQAADPDDAIVTHEPIAYRYRPRQFLRAYERMNDLWLIPDVEAHLQDILAIDDQLSYIEVGFPCFAAIPLFHELFGDRLRVVQLVRHPVPTSASLVTHDWYHDVLKKHVRDHVAILPTDPSAFQKHYAKRWHELSQYEKCLFYWTEIHLYGLEIQWRYHQVPFLRVRFEDVISEPGSYLKQLVEFVGLPYRREIAAGSGERVDRYEYKAKLRIDWSEIHDHPMAVALAESFGYDISNIDPRGFESRYQQEES